MVAFEIFWFEIYWYWLFYLFSFLIAYCFFYFLARTSYLDNFPNIKNLLKNWLDDLAVFILIWIIVWWRLWYVIFYNPSTLLDNPISVFFIWEWWMAFIWWVIWVILSMLYIAKKYALSIKDFLILMDIIVTILPFWIMLWRIWNFLNQELYWKLVSELNISIIHNNIETLKNLNLIYVYESIDSNKRINTNFLESIFEWLVLLLILMFVFFKSIYKSYYKPWFISWLFLILYWIIRFFIEFLRAPEQVNYIAWFTSTQYFMFWFIIVWIVLIIWFDKLIQKK